MPVKDVFISYGRRESKAFVKRVYDRLEAAGYKVWLDIVNIPPSDDFMQRIHNGIESADNFIFVIAPHSIQSEFCLQEIEHALSLNKRIIPILHIEPEKEHPVWEKIHPVVRKTNWVLCRELEQEGIVQEAWESLDDFGGAFEELTKTLEKDQRYVREHTQLLLRALEWEKARRQTHFLLDGQERLDAQDWLLKEFKAPEQPPCLPTPLHAEYITESRKNAENMTADVFISYAEGNEDIRKQVAMSLAMNGVTTWTHSRDIQTGQDLLEATRVGIEQADNYIFFISPPSVASKRCLLELDHALSLNKRTIPLLVEEVAMDRFPAQIQGLSFVDFTNNVKNDDYNQDLDQILNIVHEDTRYYQKHKILLSQALKWQRQQHNTSILLRGYNLQNAQIWLNRGLKRERHQPTDLHKEFIAASAAHDGEMDIEVFVAYSRKDADFARKLNGELELNGKTTWFDQDSIAEGADFEEEIYKGIASADNFLFIISPDAVLSDFCAKEVVHAAELGKRFIPVLYRPVEDSSIPNEVRRVQWINFEQGITDFQNAFNQLMRALNIDREYVQSHKKWQQKAMDWENTRQKTHREKEANELLLGETELALAEEWYQQAHEQKKDPLPTFLQKEFLAKSRTVVEGQKQKERQIEDTLRQRLRNVHYALMAGGVLLIAAITAAVFAYNKSFEALEKELQAELNARKFRSLNLTYVAEEILVEEENPQKALSVALSAYDLVQDQPSVPLLKSLRDLVNAINFNNLKHQGSVNNASFSPNGRRVITASEDHTAMIWDDQGGTIAVLSDHRDEVLGAIFSPIGTQCITFSRDQSARIWSEDGALQGNLVGHTDVVTGAAFSPDSKKILTWSRDNTAKLWATNAVGRYQLLRTLDRHSTDITDAGFSPNGKYIFTHSASDANVHLWDGTGRHRLSLSASAWNNPGNIAFFRQTDSTTQLMAISSRGRALLYDADYQIGREYNFSVNSRDTLVNGHKWSIQSACLSPDGNLLLTRSKNEAKLWNLEGGLIADLTFEDTRTPIDFALFSNHIQKDSLRILTASEEGFGRLWEYNGSLLAEATFSGHEAPLEKLVFSPDASQLLSASRNGNVRLWQVSADTASGKFTANLQSDFKGHLLSLNSITFSPDGKRILTASDDYTAKLWKVVENPFAEGHHPEKVAAWRRENTIPPLTPADKVEYELVESMDWIREKADTAHLRVYGDYFAERGRLEDAEEVYSLYLDRHFLPEVFIARADVRYQQGESFPFEEFFQTDDSSSLHVYAHFFQTKADSLQKVRQFQKEDFYKRSEKLYQKLYTLTRSTDALIQWTSLRKQMGLEIDFSLFEADRPEELGRLARFLTETWASDPFAERLPPYRQAVELYEKQLEINREIGNEVAKTKRDVATVYNSISYYYLFTKEYEKAWEAARRGKQVDETYKWIDTKLAIACLLTDREEKGMEILAENKGKTYGKDNFSSRYLEYFNKLEDAGVSHSNFEEARKYLSR